MKLCKVCSQEKPLSEFRLVKTNKDGRSLICRACLNEKARAVYADPKFIQERRAREEKSREKRRERIAETARRKYKSDREKAIAHYGGKCACCGESRFEFLAIDRKSVV